MQLPQCMPVKGFLKILTVMKFIQDFMLEMRKTLLRKVIRVIYFFIFTSQFFLYSEAARCKQYLKLMGITHVLNTAEGRHFGQVDTDHLYYRDCPRIKYLGFQMIDHPTTDIAKYFYIAAKFIDEAISSGGL